MSHKIPLNSSQQRRDTVKNFWSGKSRGNTKNICKKFDVNYLNSSQEIDGMQKYAKIILNHFP